jgi:hypothetical protein
MEFGAFAPHSSPISILARLCPGLISAACFLINLAQCNPVLSGDPGAILVLRRKNSLAAFAPAEFALEWAPPGLNGAGAAVEYVTFG